jgi:hypothetical protein
MFMKIREPENSCLENRPPQLLRDNASGRNAQLPLHLPPNYSQPNSITLLSSMRRQHTITIELLHRYVVRVESSCGRDEL